MATPPASPALRAASANPSVSPSPSTTPPSSPSPSFLATWHGRLPTIPRPSPMMPFRAAKKVVTSVTSVGTGLLPSKEQLGSIPVAGRILKHPVMDSTLTYIASKTTHRGGKGGAESKIISPEDVHYRKLNKKLVEQSVTLAALAIEHEEESKAIDDEAGDDAFELYLAAIATLMHALPIETCDPLRREAFNSQLKSFLQETELDSADEDVDTKQLRRRRRRRHREYHDQASSLIHQYSSTLSHNNSTHNNSGIVGAAPGQPQYGAEKNRRRARARKAGRRNDGRCYGKHTIEEGPTLGETIISTAVESAIRLKQSPIPDAIKTCFHASKVVFNKVDEKFRLQERAWQLSKQSIEKAIELDEQYAIHEVVTETFFAAVTGLVKAGIAYKETPSYSTVKALSSQQKQLTQPPQDAMYAAVPERPHSPQAVVKKKSTSVSSSSSSRKKRISIIAEEEEAHALKEFGSHGPSSSSSSSSLRFTTSDEDDTESDDEFEEHQSSREPFDLGRRQSLLSTASSALPAEYKKQVQQKLGLAMALRGIASLILGNAALAK
ncbi:hypothetical protein EDD11_002903 [Mortierella claussenii]|nr:hypothetical protein EDD11_002903 [Mortierella claussenii]